VLPDFHVHTPYCGHAQGKTVDYLESAVAQGLDTIGFADHLGRYYLPQSQRGQHWDWGMDQHTLSRYYTEITDLADLFAGRISVRIGLEVDYLEGAEDLLAPILKLYPLDFMLGSIHCLPKFGWRHLAKITDVAPALLYKEYFRSAGLAVESGLFQSLAHLDFIWRYVAWPEAITDQIYSWIGDVVARAAKAGTCIEMNVNGFTWSLMNDGNGIDPLGVMIEAVKRHGARITTGSDAHTPASVGSAFDDLEAFLKLKGLTDCCMFEKKKRTTRKI
jgi:histidinol-phosphatase (PHP family)